jgi:hypothetical protein
MVPVARTMAINMGRTFNCLIFIIFSCYTKIVIAYITSSVYTG